MHFSYLYSRYPVVSQTFCDTEMLALERRGCSFEIGSIHPPHTSLRHEHAARLQAPIFYAPPQEILKIGERRAKVEGRWPVSLIARHEQRYGLAGKAALRARNALYFADLFVRHGVQHVHVHFANRAAQTALFLKAISGLSFSVTAHGQDFMVDLGSIELLREICAEAEFVAAETDYSRELLRQRCPESAAKIHRVYNGMDLANFVAPGGDAVAPSEPVRILSVGRLVEFKGFGTLIDACAELNQRGCNFRCEIVGEGPLRERLQAQIEQLRLQERVALAGALSQAEIFARLRACGIFALASVVDQAGASDVFPTVILEAMASARPVVSTTVAGIPESVADGETGWLVAPNDSAALADALEKLVRDSALRCAFGVAGRKRVEENFRVETTVEPLVELLQECSLGKPASSDSHPATAPKVAYLIDHWPDPDLADLPSEIAQLRQHDLGIFAVVCRLGKTPVPDDDFALESKFLPDAMVLEAEWQQERTLARALEAEHAAALQRVPAALFLEQARAALTLRKVLARENVRHLHATSSRALVAALLVRRLLPITVSAAIERRPTLPANALKEALQQVEGGRVFDHQLVRSAPAKFLVETPPTLLRHVKLSRRERSWAEWSDRLKTWAAPR